MSIYRDIEELREVSRELEKDIRLKILRRILKILLVGFFIGRDIDRRVSETTSRRDLIIRHIREYFDDVERLLKQLEETRRVDAFTVRMSEKEQIAGLLSLGDDLKFLVTKKAAEGLALAGKEDLGKYTQIVLNCIKEYLERKKNIAERQLEEIKNSGTYLIHTEKERAYDTIILLGEDLEYFESNEILPGLCSQIQTRLKEYRQIISDYNNEFIKQRKEEYGYLFKKDHLMLDEEQKDAVVTDDKYNLVIAGAGTGKTEVLITRIAYLIKRKPDTVQSNRILAIAYQNKDVKQIEHRLHERYDIDDVEVRTFHKLGKEILQKAGRKFDRSGIVDENKKHEIIRSLYQHRLTDPGYYRLFLQYVKTLHDDEKDYSFKNKAESLAYAQRRTYFSINNTRVNSRAEKEIMDFFLMNKLNGESIGIDYEPDLPGFRPDFGLPKYDLFIEHWALDEKGEVPEWFDQTTEAYREKMQFKKEWFARNSKLLVETYAFEYGETKPDAFIELLERRIIEKLLTRNEGKFEFTPLTYSELVEVAWGPYKDPVDEIMNFITNAKTYGISPEKITEKIHNDRWSRKQVAFGNLAVKVYADYRDHLTKAKKIDFEDMINEAIAELDDNKNLYANIYDHMLIDEYQDISAQRYKLIRKLLERNPTCKLFCVGDDWQSIMAFSGSNLDFFVNFEKYFEKPAVTKISTNYRSTKTIVDAGAQLIKKNSSCQISKTTLSSRDEERAIMVFRSPHKENYRMRYYEQTAEDCLTRIAEYIRKGFLPQDILVLSRFMRTRVHRACKFHHVIRTLLDKAQEMGIDMICDEARDESKIRVLTVHKSKGLEAKVVFVLNVIKDAYGFPSEIEDSSIYAPARENYPEQNQKEEERRLFYVAMTRAKEDLIIYTWEPSKSEFLVEIEDFTQEERLSY
jgi:DNA helicase-4